MAYRFPHPPALDVGRVCAQALEGAQQAQVIGAAGDQGVDQELSRQQERSELVDAVKQEIEPLLAEIKQLITNSQQFAHDPLATAIGERPPSSVF